MFQHILNQKVYNNGINKFSNNSNEKFSTLFLPFKSDIKKLGERKSFFYYFLFLRNTKSLKYHKEKAHTKILSQYPINLQLNSNYKLLRFSRMNLLWYLFLLVFFL